MHIDLFADYTLVVLLTLALLAFAAGFIDAVVGGGGLIQLPALLINFPNTPLPTLFGTNKIAALSGTSIAAYQYSKRVKFDYRLLLAVSVCSAMASYAGAKVVTFVDMALMKPIILVALIAIAAYSLINKRLGQYQTKSLSIVSQIIYGCIIGTIVGFYDGFFGPGTGSFLVLGFVVLLGFEFIEASAYSKVINCVTNISALVVFIGHGNFLPGIALLMAVSNIFGSLIGTKLAVKRGNRFVRIVFIFIVTLMIIRFGYDIFIGG